MRRDYESYGHSLHLFETEKKKALIAYETNVVAEKNSNPKLFHHYVAKKDKYGEKCISLMDEGNKDS